MIGKIARIIIFVSNVPEVAGFYRDVLGLKITGEIDPGWTELSSGSCNIALHSSAVARKFKGDTKVKIVFGVKDVSKAKALIEKRGGVMGKIIVFGKIKFCDGRDPEGNVFQISNR